MQCLVCTQVHSHPQKCNPPPPSQILALCIMDAVFEYKNSGKHVAHAGDLRIMSVLQGNPAFSTFRSGGIEPVCVLVVF